MSWPLQRVISGAQTGADQAGLTVAVALGYQPGGMVPKGRRTEAGPLTDAQMAAWRLIESRYAGYEHRTRQNVRVSDGTVVFGARFDTGSALTLSFCDAFGKPKLPVVVGAPHTYPAAACAVRAWIVQERIRVLNVAGNRESKSPGIFDAVVAILTEALSPCASSPALGSGR